MFTTLVAAHFPNLFILLSTETQFTGNNEGFDWHQLIFVKKNHLHNSVCFPVTTFPYLPVWVCLCLLKKCDKNQRLEDRNICKVCFYNEKSCTVLWRHDTCLCFSLLNCSHLKSACLFTLNQKLIKYRQACLHWNTYSYFLTVWLRYNLSHIPLSVTSDLLH